MSIERLKQLTYENELIYWLALLRAPHLGSVTFNYLRKNLLQKGIKTMETLFLAKPKIWEALGLPLTLQNYLRHPDWDSVKHDLEWMQQPGCHIIRIGDPDYPSLLAEIPTPPPLLFVKGNVDRLSSLQIAVVGSRNATLPGQELAEELAAEMANKGLTVTSGLARGIDGAAHRGALSVDAYTLAVLGTGIDRIYPYQHRDLADEICAKGGALLSEFPLGIGPHRSHFPQRNRIISGLSLGVVVVEASLRSGSLITARLAAEQGREVFAVPGAPGHPLACGTHHLIRQGAKLTETLSDILEELPIQQEMAITQALVETVDQVRRELVLDKKRIKKRYFCKDLDENRVKLLQCVGFQPTLINIVIKRSGLSPAEVAAGLLDLELKGYICAIAGNAYLRRS